MNSSIFDAPAVIKSRIKPLRPRLSAKMCGWFNEAGLGSAADTRRTRKNRLLHVVRHRLMPGVEDARALINRGELRCIFRQHRDYPAASGPEAGRKWIERSIKHLEATPCVSSFSTYILLDEFNALHGSDESINAHHAAVAHSAKVNGAAASQRFRTRVSGMSAADALKRTPEPKKHIVMVSASKALNLKKANLYNALPPTLSQAEPKQASGFAAKRRKRADAVSANRATKPKSSRPLASIRPQRGKTLAKPSAIPKIPVYRERPDFDPRTNPKARRVYAHGSLDAPFVGMMVKVHEQLAGLSYGALRKRGATNDTLYMACHLMMNSENKVTKPVGWVMWMEKALRDGVGRYA